MDLPNNEPELPSLAAEASATRRTFIRAAGALGLAATAFPAALELPGMPAASAAAAAQFLGSNQGVFKEIRSGKTIGGVKFPGVPGLSGVRIYGLHPTGKHFMTDRIAKSWPKATPPPVVAHPGPIVYSIYPVPEHVLNGSLFHALKNLIASAPPNSYLTTWHEALSLKYPKYITSDAMFQLHARMNTLVKGSNVTYGAIFGGGDLTKLFHSAPPNLGFYGLDLYGNLGIQKGLDRLEEFIKLAKPKDTKAHYPKIMIPECNAPKQSDRPAWFKAVCQRMHKYGSHSIGVLTFWNGPGNLGGPWDPTDRATINEMNSIIKTIF